MTSTTSSPYILTPADPQDAPAIAALFAQSWTSSFARLQFGTHVSAETLTPRIEKQIRNSQMRFDVMRSQGLVQSNGKHNIAAVAHWTIPQAELSGASVEGDGGVVEDGEVRKEREEFEDEAFRKSLPDEYNKDLIMEFKIGLRELRKEVIGDRKHYLLENLATHPSHRGQGLATQLIRAIIPLADTSNTIIYLDTASDNPARSLYAKLGFEERGRSTVARLERFGGEGEHVHVGMVRETAGVGMR